MPKVSINDIFPGSALKEDLYHIESGTILLKKGEVFRDEFLDIFEQCHIEFIFRGVSPFEVTEFLFDVNHKTIPVNASMLGQSFTTPLFDRKKRVLVEPNIPINDNFIKLISKSGGVVYQQKTASEIDSTTAENFKQQYKNVVESSLAKAEPAPAEKPAAPIAVKFETKVETIAKVAIQEKEYGFNKAAETIAENVKISADFVDNDLVSRKKPQKIEIVPDAVLLQMGVKDPLIKRTEAYKKTFLETYNDLLKDVTAFFKSIAENSTSKVDSQVKKICSRIVNTLIADKNLVINLTNTRKNQNDYLVQHSLNVAIFSINIGCSIGYSESQIFELTFGALLSDLGIMRIDKNVLSKKGLLTNDERRTVEKHPAFSLDFLNNIKGVPSSTPYIVYQSHEKLDGTGYPKSRPSFLIHEFAKIINIADTFDALCSDRPWRPAYSPYKAMEEIIRLAGQKKIDGKIIRQWLFSISLFPVGSYVNLNDSSIAKVISSNPNDFTRPNLRAIAKEGVPIADPPTIILSDNKELKITRAIPQSELQFQVLDGF